VEKAWDVPESEVRALLVQWFYVGQENSAYCLNGKAVVIGFGMKYIQYGGFDHKHAGIYFDFTTLRIAKLNYEEMLDSRALLDLENSPRQMKLYEKMKALNVRISDLPNTPFWVGDKVLA